MPVFISPAPLLCLHSAAVALIRFAFLLPLLSASRSATRWIRWRCHECWRALWLWLWSCLHLAEGPRSAPRSNLATTWGKESEQAVVLFQWLQFRSVDVEETEYGWVAAVHLCQPHYWSLSAFKLSRSASLWRRERWWAELASLPILWSG